MIILAKSASQCAVAFYHMVSNGGERLSVKKPVFANVSVPGLTACTETVGAIADLPFPAR